MVHSQESWERNDMLLMTSKDLKSIMMCVYGFQRDLEQMKWEELSDSSIKQIFKKSAKNKEKYLLLWYRKSLDSFHFTHLNKVNTFRLTH